MNVVGLLVSGILVFVFHKLPVIKKKASLTEEIVGELGNIARCSSFVASNRLVFLLLCCVKSKKKDWSAIAFAHLRCNHTAEVNAVSGFTANCSNAKCLEMENRILINFAM